MCHSNTRAKSNALPPATTTRNKIPHDNRFSMPGAKRMQHAVHKANRKELPDGIPIAAFHRRNFELREGRQQGRMDYRHVRALHGRNCGRQFFTENLLLTSNEHIEGFRFLYRLFRFCNSRRHRYSRFISRRSIHCSTFLRHHDLSRGRSITRPTNIKALFLDCSRSCNRKSQNQKKYNQFIHEKNLLSLK